VLDGRPGRSAGVCLPVLRHPNFSDKTCDVPLDRFQVLVGNQRGGALQRVTLRQYLESFAAYQHAPTGYLNGPLVGERDRVALTSAQACFLPVPQGGETRFAPVLFSYQSRRSSPAVLTILATPEGTSAQVISFHPDATAGVVHGQRLFHNRDGRRAPLTARRFSDHQAQQAAAGQHVHGDAATRDGLSLVMIVQIPLVVPERHRDLAEALDGEVCKGAAGCPPPAAAKRGSDVESAVVASGPAEGPWLGLDGCTIQRDWRFPIRVTVQFYQATSSAAIDAGDVERLGRSLDRIYLDADAVGSLVVDGATDRPTETVQPLPHHHHQQGCRCSGPREAVFPQPWWQEVCDDYQRRSGETWSAALQRVRARLGQDWQPADARELRNALDLVRPAGVPAGNGPG